MDKILWEIKKNKEKIKKYYEMIINHYTKDVVENIRIFLRCSGSELSLVVHFERSFKMLSFGINSAAMKVLKSLEKSLKVFIIIKNLSTSSLYPRSSRKYKTSRI